MNKENLELPSQFEQAFMQAVAQYQNQEAKQVKIGQFERETQPT